MRAKVVAWGRHSVLTMPSLGYVSYAIQLCLGKGQRSQTETKTAVPFFQKFFAMFFFLNQTVDLVTPPQMAMGPGETQ